MWWGQIWGHPKVPKWSVRAPSKGKGVPQGTRILRSKKSKSLKRILRQGVASRASKFCQSWGAAADPSSGISLIRTHAPPIGIRTHFGWVSSRSIWLGQTWGQPKVPKWSVRAPRKGKGVPQGTRILRSKRSKSLKRILRQGVASGASKFCQSWGAVADPPSGISEASASPEVE